MNTLKTGVVVIVLLAVLYGVYVVLNNPQDSGPASITQDPHWQGSTMAPDAPVVSLGAPSDGADMGSNSSLGTPVSPPTDGNWDQFLGSPGAETSAPSSTNINRPQGERPSRQAPGMTTMPPDYPPPNAQAAVGEPTPSQSASSTFTPHSAMPPSATPSQNRQGVSESNTSSAIEMSPGANGHRSSSLELGQKAFRQAWVSAVELIEKGSYRQALAVLTPFYRSPDLTADEHRQLLSALDPLAGRVIYSTEHLLLDPYVARSGETLQDIAKRLDIPWRLLQNINGIQNPNVLIPGSKLKVVKGPFHGQIHLSDSQLTLFVDNLYAGRFDVEVMNPQTLATGHYQVRQKTEWPPYITADGRRIPSRDRANPYGQWHLDLGHGVALHSSSPAGEAARQGSISLSPKDAADVYGILSLGSQVEIQR